MRLIAARALTQSDTKEARAYLEAAALDPDPTVRSAVARISARPQRNSEKSLRLGLTDPLYRRQYNTSAAPVVKLGVQLLVYSNSLDPGFRQDDGLRIVQVDP